MYMYLFAAIIVACFTSSRMIVCLVAQKSNEKCSFDLSDE